MESIRLTLRGGGELAKSALELASLSHKGRAHFSCHETRRLAEKAVTLQMQRCGCSLRFFISASENKVNRHSSLCSSPDLFLPALFPFNKKVFSHNRASELSLSV